jgi:hypothetical protein
MKLLVFLHGTAIMHKAALGHSREERVRQGIDKDPSVYDYTSYVPVGNVVQKLKHWEQQGAIIAYLSSHTDAEDAEKDKSVLTRYNFPEGEIYFRRNKETYADVAEKVMPNILIEDDCESIGGKKEMTYPHLRSEVKTKIKSIVVKEFGGIDHLPNALAELNIFRSGI